MIQFTQIDGFNRTYNCNMPVGDSGEIPITVVGYDLQLGDKILFKFGKNLDTPIITKEVTTFVNNTAIIKINPTDTEMLEPDLYFYVCKLIKATNEVDTFIEKSIFELEGA